MKVVFDLDGTVIVDEKNYDSEEFTFTPLVEAVKRLQGNATVIAVTGRTMVPKKVAELFDEVITRPFPFEPAKTYYARYVEWKCKTIWEMHPDLIYDDDQQITSWLIDHGINAVWIQPYRGEK